MKTILSSSPRRVIADAVQALLERHRGIVWEASRSELIAAVLSDHEALSLPCGALATWGSTASTGRIPQDTYIVKQVFTETPFYVTMTLKFTGGELSCAIESNVGFGATKKPAVVGRAE